MTQVCVLCKVEKSRVFNRTQHGGRKLFTEGYSGGQWNGLKCPPCIYLYKKKKEMMALRDTAVGPDLIIDPLTHRLCRVCRHHLPASRYFSHSYCTPGMPYVR